MNPLLEKYEELYGKKEKPKIPRIEDYEGEKTIADELEELRDTSTILVTTPKGTNIISAKNANVSVKPRALQTYDVDSCKDEFLRVAEKVKQGDARVTCLTMNADVVSNFHTGLRTIIFEVQVYDAP